MYCVYICIYIYIYIHIYLHTHIFVWSLLRLACFRKWPVEAMPIGDFPESLSQAMLVGIMLVGRLGVLGVCLESPLLV